MPVWVNYLLVAVGSLLLGGIIAFFVTRKIFIKQVKDNPPVNEKMIRAMYLSMGVKPSESKIKQTMNAMNRARDSQK